MKSKAKIIAELDEALVQSKAHKNNGNKEAFDLAMTDIFVGLKGYIKLWLLRAVSHEKMHAGKYKVDDFIDELYIAAYDHLFDFSDGRTFYVWLYKKADEILKDAEIEEEFDDLYFKNIANYRKDEWNEMEEKYSIDGGGDLVMIEDLDDLSYAKNDYPLQDVFVEDKEKGIIDKLDQDLEQENINSHINLVLSRLAVPARTVYDLTARYSFSIEEVSEIKQLTVQEVEQYLSNARRSIQESLKSRFISK